MDNFLLILTLCGTPLHGNNLHTGGYACDDFVIDTNQSELDCYKSIATVYNQEKTSLYDIMADSGLMFKQVKVTKLACAIEDKE